MEGLCLEEQGLKVVKEKKILIISEAKPKTIKEVNR